MEVLKQKIEAAWEDRSLLEQAEYIEAVEAVVAHIDAGTLRCAEPTSDGRQVNE